MSLSVLSVASEIFPLVKTGGLADVTGALPGALAGEGVAVRTLVPGYPAVTARLEGEGEIRAYGDLFGGPARVMAGRAAGLDLLVLDAPHLFDRPGNPYVGPDGLDWPDNAFRFAALGRAGADLSLGTGDWKPDLVHVHDWQAGLVPAYLHYDGAAAPPTVVTIHNLAFQGVFPADLLVPLGLPARAWSVDGVEYFGAISYLKAALLLSRRITTVSPTYAVEIRSAEGGMGLEGLLQSRAAAVTGIVNGIDDTVWDPATDPMLPVHFDARRIKARGHAKRALQDWFGLRPDPEMLLFGLVSRLTWQKGIDILFDRIGTILQEGAQLAVLGAGDASLEEGFRTLAVAHPDRVGCRIGYDERLAHLIQAGSDAVLVPSRFEPCGLTQLCALRYGALPVVARVGGLADTVIDANEAALAAGVATGIQFNPVNAAMLEHALHRTAVLWRDQKTWREMQKNAMRADVSWRASARRYAELFREVVGT
jgi:starch synthase